MIAEFLHTIRRLRGQAIGWSIGLVLLGLLLGSMYDSVSAMEGITELLESYPPEMLAFFGEITEVTTPWGYLDAEFFTLMSMVIGIFGIGTCVRMIAGDEEKGLLDLELSHPISRLDLFWGRMLAFIVVLLGILLTSWLSMAVPSKAFGFDLTPVEFIRPFLSLFAILMFFAAFSLLASLILPSSRLAGALSGAFMVGNFLLLGLANLNEDLEPIVEFTPLYYYQGGEAINDFQWESVVGLLTASLLFTLLACIAFIKRDIRVSGEHSWSFSGSSLLIRAWKGLVALWAGFMLLLRKWSDTFKKSRVGIALVNFYEENKRKTWAIIILIILMLIIIGCCVSMVIIEATDQWCDLFADLFNFLSEDSCP